VPLPSTATHPLVETRWEEGFGLLDDDMAGLRTQIILLRVATRDTSTSEVYRVRERDHFWRYCAPRIEGVVRVLAKQLCCACVGGGVDIETTSDSDGTSPMMVVANARTWQGSLSGGLLPERMTVVIDGRVGGWLEGEGASIDVQSARRWWDNRGHHGNVGMGAADDGECVQAE
jgi:hypothetical protein